MSRWPAEGSSFTNRNVGCYDIVLHFTVFTRKTNTSEHLLSQTNMVRDLGPGTQCWVHLYHLCLLSWTTAVRTSAVYEHWEVLAYILVNMPDILSVMIRHHVTASRLLILQSQSTIGYLLTLFHCCLMMPSVDACISQHRLAEVHQFS